MEWIDDVVNEVLTKCKTSNPFEICEILKIKVVLVNIDSPLLLGNKSIYIASLKAIFIQDDLPYHLYLFYLRHEIGHAVLHPNIYSLKRNLINVWKQEKQANYFACRLEGVQLDKTRFYQMPISNISSILEIPEKALKQLANM